MLIKSTAIMAVFLAAVTLGLSGCAGSQKLSYSNVDELRLAYEGAGGDCNEWNQDNAVDDALESGSCDTDTVLMIFDSKEGAENRAGALQQMLSAFGMETHLLLGENWLINSSDVQVIEPKLGGKLIVG